jgi:hypothetical protein
MVVFSFPQSRKTLSTIASIQMVQRVKSLSRLFKQTDNRFFLSQSSRSYMLALELMTTHRRQSWGLGVVTPQILKWRGLGVVEGVVSGLLRSKGEGREPGTPSFQTRLTPL